jgi:hypothetical protein
MPHRYPDTALNLEILSEESAEVIAEMIATLSRVIRLKSKITRFGIDDHHPGNGAPNRQALETELGHLLAMIHCLTEHGVLDWKALNTARHEKVEKRTRWYGPRAAGEPYSSSAAEVMKTTDYGRSVIRCGVCGRRHIVDIECPYCIEDTKRSIEKMGHILLEPANQYCAKCGRAMFTKAVLEYCPGSFDPVSPPIAQPSGIRCTSQCTGTCGSENLCPAAVTSRG